MIGFLTLLPNIEHLFQIPDTPHVCRICLCESEAFGTTSALRTETECVDEILTSHFTVLETQSITQFQKYMGGCPSRTSNTQVLLLKLAASPHEVLRDGRL